MQEELNNKLLEAAKIGDIAAFKALMDQGADIHFRDKEFGSSALLWAAYNGHIPMVKYLLKSNLSEVSERNDKGESPLLLAAAKGQIPMVEYLLMNKLSEVSEKNNDATSALLLAGYHGHIPTVQILLKRGALVDVLTNSGQTVYQFIQQHPRAKKETLPLIAAAEILLKLAPHADGKSEELSNALNTLDDALNGTRVSDGNSALHLAILYKNKALVQMLLEQGADTELPNNDNRTPQQLALYSGVPYIKHCFNLRKINELSKTPVAMELDSDEEAVKGSKEAKESKETKEAKESLEHSMIQTEALDKLIEVTLKAIQELSEENERNELFYYLGTILSKADSPSFRPLLAYQLFNTITPQSLKQYEAAHYKAYELIMGRHIIIRKAKNQIEEELEVFPNMGFIPNDEVHRSLRLKTLLKHLHLAKYQDMEGQLFSKLVAEFALGEAESMKGIPGLTGINCESQFALTNLLRSFRLRFEEEKNNKDAALAEKQYLIIKAQELSQKNERLTAEIVRLKSQLLNPFSVKDPASEEIKKIKDNPLGWDPMAVSQQEEALEFRSSASYYSPVVLHHFENTKTEADTFPSYEGNIVAQEVGSFNDKENDVQKQSKSAA